MQMVVKKLIMKMVFGKELLDLNISKVVQSILLSISSLT